MRRAALLFALLLAAGCGNWSDEDAEFQAAAPRREDLTLRPPDQGTRTQSLEAGDYGTRSDRLTERSEVYATVTGMARDVNELVGGLTAGLDMVRQVPPSLREPDRRVWGPYDDRDRPGYQVQVEMRRSASGAQYTYQVQSRRKGIEDFVAIITGTFEGERVSQGRGSFELHRGRAAAIGWPVDEGGEVTLSYDMAGGVTAAALKSTPESGPATMDVRYRVERDGGGWMKFDVESDLVKATPRPERLSLAARWLADSSGRAEVMVSKGDLGEAVGNIGECWAPDQTRVWMQRDFDCDASPCEVGREQDCSVASAQ